MLNEDGGKTTRLESFKIDKLFGEFNYFIRLNQEAHVTALTAPNGAGKTVCLRLVSALFRRQWSIFSTTDFEKIEYNFSNGYKVIVRHRSPSDLLDEASENLSFDMYLLDKKIESWSPRFEIPPQRLHMIEGFVPFLTRTAPSRWTHDRTGQNLSLQEVLENYSEQFPNEFVSKFRTNLPAILGELIGSINCHLIETQRLLILGNDSPRRNSPPSQLTISLKAKLLKDIIAEELTAYAALSQSLDRTFPRRVIQNRSLPVPERLKEDLQELDDLRRKLMEAGILDTEQDEVLPPSTQFDKALAALLSVYVEDTKRKLSSLSPILERITLFRKLIEDRFQPKAISISRELGFAVTRVGKAGRLDIPLEKLSSGEQHQLVLFFELLFQTKPGTLILIDEPELSLHVSWQKKFIPDLLKIIELNKFDVLLATHSPQLIGWWDDIVVDLGEEVE
jgi:ABC-type transport system involved in cytochrome c biogenesis ATPase subunit